MSSTKRKLAVSGLFFCLLIATFLTGAFAHRSCVYPFCQGYYVSLKDSAEDILNPVNPNTSDTLSVVGKDTADTNLYRISVDRLSMEGVLDKQYERYRDGGIASLGNGVIVVSNNGDIVYINKKLEASDIDLRVPFSSSDFREYIKNSDYSDNTEERSDTNLSWFSVKDIASNRISENKYQIITSYNDWDNQEKCYTLKVSRTTIVKRRDSLRSDDGRWENVYETSPCLHLKDKGNPFGGLQSGGRIVYLSDKKILVSVGDFEFDGLAGRNLPQDAGNDYGKIVHVDLETGTSRIYTKGHRNPQGLHIDEQGRIWATEHGPKGGDELNLIEEEKNYGWPQVTYGTCYGHETRYRESCNYSWPLSQRAGTHEKFVRPMFAWVPSIGISQVISIENDLFELWNGDLLIASLTGKKLFRTRIRESRVVFSEPIGIGERIRDLTERKDGAVVLKTGRGNLIVLRPANSELNKVTAAHKSSH